MPFTTTGTRQGPATVLWYRKVTELSGIFFCNHQNRAGPRDCVVVEESQGSFQVCLFATTGTWQDTGTVLWWRKAKAAFRHVLLQPPEPGRTQGLCCGRGKSRSFQAFSFATTRTGQDSGTVLWWRKAKVAFRHVLLQPTEPGRTQGLCCGGGKPR